MQPPVFTPLPIPFITAFTDECSTPMTQSEPQFARAIESAVAIAPMNRMGTAQEIADACLFLCSSKASFVQGAAMVILPSPVVAAYMLTYGV